MKMIEFTYDEVYGLIYNLENPKLEMLEIQKDIMIRFLKTKLEEDKND